MRQYRPTKSFSWLLLLLSFLVQVATYSQAEAGHDQEQEMYKHNMDAVTNNNPFKWKLLSSPPSLTVAAYWEAIKYKYSTLGTAPLSFLSPPKPNTDFRGDLGEDKEEIGTTEKVKGAVGKSMEKTKDALEESAKSAAKITTETANMLKDTILTDPADEF